MSDDGRLERHTDVQQYIRIRNSPRQQYEKPVYRNIKINETSDSLGLQLESCKFPEKDGHEGQASDFLIYVYFLKPAGWHLTLLFLLAAVAAATMKKMPGKFKMRGIINSWF